jgi:hypothetical protein
MVGWLVAHVLECGYRGKEAAELVFARNRRFSMFFRAVCCMMEHPPGGFLGPEV